MEREGQRVFRNNYKVHINMDKTKGRWNKQQTNIPDEHGLKIVNKILAKLIQSTLKGLYTMTNGHS